MSQANPKRARPTGALAAHRQRLREEAEERQAHAAAMSPEERLRVLDGRPGEAERERARLKERIAAAKPKRPVSPTDKPASKKGKRGRKGSR